MTDFDQTFPPILTELHDLDFDYDEGNGYDFEPYDSFFPASENRDWIRAWTGNDELDGGEYRIFGQDGTGGYVAFWLVRDGAALLDQPIVFFGSEGAVGVVANDFADYLWLLAGGYGPMEVVEHGAEGRSPNEAFTAFAKAHAPAARKTPAEVLERARTAYPDFEEHIRALCR